jgi:anti-anti-sigma factor
LPEALCLSLAGQFDGQASEIFSNYILDLVQADRSKRIILDMAHLDDLSMAGIRALLEARSNVYSLSIVQVPESIYRVLELAGTTDFFAIYGSVNEAIGVITNSSINASG